MACLNNLDKTKKLISQKKLLQFGYVVIFVNNIGDWLEIYFCMIIEEVGFSKSY